MKVLLFGRGVLGTALANVIHPVHQLLQTSLRDGVDIANSYLISHLIQESEPDVIINAAGCIGGTPVEMIHANTIGPRVIRSVADCPIIHVSTDCVFVPDRLAPRYSYNTVIPPEDDMYSLTKLAGELTDRTLVVRTSFVGRGSRMWDGVIRAAERNEIYPGWDTLWTGSHVEDVAHVIAGKALDDVMNRRVGIVHAAIAKPIKKFDVAVQIARIENLRGHIVLAKGPKPRILIPTPGYVVRSMVE